MNPTEHLCSVNRTATTSGRTKGVYLLTIPSVRVSIQPATREQIPDFGGEILDRPVIIFTKDRPSPDIRNGDRLIDLSVIDPDTATFLTWRIRAADDWDTHLECFATRQVGP